MSWSSSDQTDAHGPRTAPADAELLGAVLDALTRRGYEWSDAPAPSLTDKPGDVLEPTETEDDSSKRVRRTVHLDVVGPQSPFYPQLKRDSHALTISVEGGRLVDAEVELLDLARALLVFAPDDEPVLEATDVRVIRSLVDTSGLDAQGRDWLMVVLRERDKVALASVLGAADGAVSRALCAILENPNDPKLLRGLAQIPVASPEFKAGVAHLGELEERLGGAVRLNLADLYGMRTLTGLSFAARCRDGRILLRGGTFLEEGVEKVSLTYFLSGAPTLQDA